MPFRTGPDVNPFDSAARDGIRLLESATAAHVASAIPRIVITKIDFKTGRPDTSVRPLMYDLVQGPQIGASDFGVEQDRFLERGTVSLESVEIKARLLYGLDVQNDVMMRFVVHRPDIVFDRSSKIAWREILEEGKAFTLEYGWIADPVACPNELFNGLGTVTDSGIPLKSTKIVLLLVSRWLVHLRPNGEIEVTVEAHENGDIALRTVRFSDVAGAAIGVLGPPAPDGSRPKVSPTDAGRALAAQIKGSKKIVTVGRGKYVRLGDILDDIAAPMLEAAVSSFGYKGSPPINMLLANFNRNAGSQSTAWGGRPMALKSMAEFLIPQERLIEQLSQHLAEGRALWLREFLNYLFNFINSDEAWGPTKGDELRPHIGAVYTTTKGRQGLSLNMMILDRNAAGDNVKGLGELPLERQTRSDVMDTLAKSNVPVLEFGRGGSIILDANFEMQPEPLLQSIQIETAEAGRKDRVEKTQMPNTESRAGYAFPHDIVPISILEGDVTMMGNFVIDTFNQVWIDFFGSSSISGIFNVVGRTDQLASGKFVTQYHMISEGIDPLNTRFRFTPEEKKSREDAQKALTQQKSK